MGNNLSLVDNENTLKSFWLYSEVYRTQVTGTGGRIELAVHWADSASYDDHLKTDGTGAMPSGRGPVGGLGPPGCES